MRNIWTNIEYVGVVQMKQEDGIKKKTRRVTLTRIFSPFFSRFFRSMINRKPGKKRNAFVPTTTTRKTKQQKSQREIP